MSNTDKFLIWEYNGDINRQDAEEVMSLLNKADIDCKVIYTEDVGNLFHEVDELYESFRDRLLEEIQREGVISQ